MSTATATKLRAGILVVSETASVDPSTDKCIPALKSVFDELGNGQWEVVMEAIARDDIQHIQGCIANWSDDVHEGEPMNLIVTSGGTGFAVGDVTPEV